MNEKIKRKDKVVLSICVMTALITIIGCVYLVNELGFYFNNIAYTRLIFGIGIVVGFTILWSGQVLGYLLIKWKNKK